jgi:hypothetical protein
MLEYPAAPGACAAVGDRRPAHYEAKRRALATYSSQFEAGDGPATHLASGHYLAAVEGRDRAYGNSVACELGEGFTSPGPLPAGEVVWLLGG